MAVFDPHLLKTLRYLSLVSRRVGGGLLATPSTRLPAGGTELTGHRDYTPGDDYRLIDWNICARHDELVVRRFQGEADRHVYLLLDCSWSMSLGSPPKFDVARQAAVALAYLGLADLARVSLLVFSDRIVAELPPLRDKGRILKAVRFLDALRPRRDRTDLASVAASFVGRCQRHGLAVILSDLYDPAGFRAALEILRRRGYSPRVVQIYESRDMEPDVLGDVELFDVESEDFWQVTVTEGSLARYRRLFRDFRRAVRSYCDSHALTCAQIPNDLPQEEFLLRAIGARR